MSTQEIIVASDVVVDSELSLAAAMHLDTQFSTTALYGSGDATTGRRLTWSTGNNEAFAANGKTPLSSARGFYIDKSDEDEPFPDDYELIETMEALCAQSLASECVVSHRDENGKPRKVPSWHLPVASLFIICEGVPSKQEMQASAECRWGVAYSGWQAGAKSALVFQCFIKELMDAGYNGIFTVKFSSYLTDKALLCLKAHEYVLKFADELRKRTGENIGVPYYAYALPITCSVKTITARKGQDKQSKEQSKEEQSKEVYYPVPSIPRLSLRSEESAAASIAFLASTAITRDQALILEAGDRVESTVAWSVATSKKLAGGEVIEGPGGGEVLDDSLDSYVPVDMDGNQIKSPF